MTTHELARKLLEGPDLPACGYAAWDDSPGVASSLEVRTAGRWDDRLPEGTDFVLINFHGNPKEDARRAGRKT
jgi:hypothetical protein